ncbi:MAG: phosphonate-transporting ATPase [Chitinophagaceae bacterium]|nr:phosphonate-transporting ATPase [Chitinophagaceae bacterium]
MNSLIKLSYVNKIYLTSQVETTALNNLSLEIIKGEFVSVMGPSGCGKSTLLNILGLLDQPDNGSYLLDGIEVGNLNEESRTYIRKQKIGFVFQGFNLIEELTVYENVELPLIYAGLSLEERKRRVADTLHRLKIYHRRRHFPEQLSGGQQQRTAIARAVINCPEVILADEPTGNLDSSTRAEVMELLCDLNACGTTVLMVTHSEHDAAYSHRIIRMLDGCMLDDRARSITKSA